MEPLVHRLLGGRPAARQPAFLTAAGSLSYADFAAMISAAAARLRRGGLQRGDRVLVCGPNCPETAAAYFAVHAAGGVAVPVDPAMPADARQWVAGDAEVRLALSACPLPPGVPAEDLADFVRCPPNSRAEAAGCGLDDPADLLYTSGTTARKKGVLLTQRQIAQAAVNIQAFVRSRPGDVELVSVPLSHSFGLGRLRAMVVSGATLVLEPGMRNPARTLQRLLELRASGLVLVPAGFELLLRLTADRLAAARDHLRYIEIGSAPLALQRKRRLMALLPETRICHHYGLTEASRAAFLEYHAEQDKLLSIGRPAPNVEMAVGDGEGHPRPQPKGPPQPAGGEGELLVRGGMVMQEYWKQPELTRRVLRDGWLRTGDWGSRDAEGYFHLLGRQSDLINVGGLKASPQEIEQVLDAHPAVVESACVGVPDPQEVTGECVKACIVTRWALSDEELVQWLRGRLEEYKIPRVWERVDRVPRTASGKIQRPLMRQETCP